GAVSLRAHLLHGAHYRSLMLVDVVAIPPTGSPFFRFVQEHPGLLADLPEYIHEAIVTAYVQAASHRGLRVEEVKELVGMWSTAGLVSCAHCSSTRAAVACVTGLTDAPRSVRKTRRERRSYGFGRRST